ncbi:flavodoxin family protein [Lentisalinibacter orientalis]|uniref:flavodoxin family protein n=1 Tax=Lentisalinibacter orientalis TaxID=2992241 RepID=UPI0038650913
MQRAVAAAAALDDHAAMADKHLLIVYHSQSGTTERMAEAVIRGARHEEIDGVTVRVLGALEADADDVLWSDALILGTPENFGYMSGGLKVFLDRVYYPCLEKVEGKPYALFVRAGNDGTGAVTSVQRIVAGLALKEVQPPLVIAGEFDEARLDECEELGMTVAAGLEAGVF